MNVSGFISSIEGDQGGLNIQISGGGQFNLNLNSPNYRVMADLLTLAFVNGRVVNLSLGHGTNSITGVGAHG